VNVADGNTDVLLRLMSAATLRARVLAGNLSNQNTPGYRRKVVDFEDRLARALERGPDRARDVEPLVVADELTPAGPDGNNVNMELEVNAMRENRLAYETYASILSYKVALVRAGIQEVR
jgi:flagellar basal-body rod protein FlgB